MNTSPHPHHLKHTKSRVTLTKTERMRKATRELELAQFYVYEITRTVASLNKFPFGKPTTR